MIAIWKKDLHQFWWVIVLATGLLCRLAWIDGQRDQSMPSAEEGWLNIFLPLAWACLLTVAVQEDGPGGKPGYWRSLPVRWREVLAAKVWFALTAIHLPYLVATIAILTMRDLLPTASVAHLAGQQLRVLGTVTLPVLGLAALLQNLSQVMLAILVGLALSAAGASSVLHTGPIEEVWIACAAVTGAVASISIACLRYSGRGRWVSGVIAVAAVLICATWMFWLPRPLRMALKTHFLNDPSPLGLSPILDGPFRSEGTPRGAVSFSIPTRIEGLEEGLNWTLWLRSLKLTGRPGALSMDTSQRGDSPFQMPIMGFAYRAENGLCWHQLSFSRAEYARWAGQSVEITGEGLAQISRWQNAVESRVGDTIAVPKAGRCHSEVVASDVPGASELIRLGCESGAAIPGMVQVTLSGQWTAYPGTSTRGANYPVLSWLSPVGRKTGFFHLSDEPSIGAASQSYLVPASLKASATLRWRVALPEGERLVRYHWRDLDLSRYRAAK